MSSFGSVRLSRYNEDGTHPDCPVGFRFCPSGQDIIQEFLVKKVLQQEMPDHPMKEMDVYRYDPAELPITITNGRERWMYFFVFMNDENMNHSTPNGYWKLDEQDVCIRDELTGNVIGFRNSFVYYTNELGPNGRYKTNWFMDEYRTKGIENLDNPQMKNWVLCKIETLIPQVHLLKATKNRRGRLARGGKKEGVNDSAEGKGVETRGFPATVSP